MLEAYQIGVFLILNDNISAGLNNVRRDLSILYQAVNTTRVQLCDLHNFATSVSALRLPDVSLKAPTAASAAHGFDETSDLRNNYEKTNTKTATEQPMIDLASSRAEPTRNIKQESEIKIVARDPFELSNYNTNEDIPIDIRSLSLIHRSSLMQSLPPISNERPLTALSTSERTDPSNVSAISTLISRANEKTNIDRERTDTDSKYGPAHIAGQVSVLASHVFNYSGNTHIADTSLLFKSDAVPAITDRVLAQMGRREMTLSAFANDTLAFPNSAHKNSYVPADRPLRYQVGPHAVYNRHTVDGPRAISEGGVGILHDFGSGRGKHHASKNRHIAESERQQEVLAGLPPQPTTIESKSTNFARANGDQSYSAGDTVDGDIYIDGAYLGRWVSRHVADELSRPGSGISGFDLKQNLVWPGAAVGT